MPSSSVCKLSVEAASKVADAVAIVPEVTPTVPAELVSAPTVGEPRP